MKSRLVIAWSLVGGDAKRVCAALTAGLVLACALPSLALASPGAVPNAPAQSASEAGGASNTATPAPSIFIGDFAVEGNTVLGAEVIEKALTPYLGPDKHFSDIEAARKALEKSYQDAGYLSVFVDIPEQRLDPDTAPSGEGSVVRLHVTEGKVARLAVTGSRYHDQAVIREKVASLSEGSVPNFNQVQQQLATVNSSDELRVQPILRPGKTPGTVEAELQVADKLPVSGEVELNNRQSPNTTPLRLNATLRYDNLFQSGQSAALTLITSPLNTAQSQVAVFNYTIPAAVGTWALYGLYSNSNVAALGALDVLGKGNVEGLRYVLPLTPDAAFYQTASFGVDVKHFEQSTTGPLRYVPLSLAYNATRTRESSQTQVSLTGTMGVRQWKQQTVDCYGVPTDQFDCTRSGASGDFSTLRLDLKHTQQLWGRWSGSLHLGGQFTDAPLISNEEYAIGGIDSVRGYLEAEQVGDRALQASVQVQTPNAAARGADAAPTWFEQHAWFKKVTDFHGVWFFDLARAYVLDPALEQQPEFTFASTGLGFNLRAGKSLSSDLYLAWPLRADAPYTQAHHPRLNGRVVVDF